MLYLIKRGPKGEHYNAPFHPVIISDRKTVMEREADWSGEKAWVWQQAGRTEWHGWLLLRWQGLVIDYGHIARKFTLPDGTEATITHRHENAEPWTLLPGAVWWSSRRMPEWVAKAGVIYPPDDFSQQRILDDESNDGCGGFGRVIPPHWSVEPGAPVRDSKLGARMAAFGRTVEQTFKAVESSMVINKEGDTHVVTVKA